MHKQRRARAAIVALGSFVVAAAVMAAPTTPVASAGAVWPWYSADLHVHSVLSADARPDLGIIASNARAAGYNAIFVTDHNLGSTFPISSLTANHLVLDDSYTRWDVGSGGSLSSSANAFVNSPVHSGSASLHLMAASGTAGQTFAWSTRGPNFSSGDAIVKFSLYPQRLDPGSSLYVSASIGGDRAVKKPAGYTTSAGVVSPGKSEVFVWYFGSQPPASLFPGSGVVATALNASGACDRGYATGVWITCTIDLNSAMSRLAAADLPDRHDAWTDLKIAAAGAAGTADGFFDSYSIDASAPVAAGDEYVDRNASLSQMGTGAWDSATFHLFPSIELGISKHAQRFNFGITDPSQNLWYQNGIDGIAGAQASGYPAQLNHPGVPGGVTQQEAINTNGEGADAVEVRQPVMIAAWDGILNKGVPIVGTWGTDNHLGSWGSGSQATFINAPDMSFDALMRSFFEGRVYLANVGFTGRAVMNLDCGSAPYPSRYPVFVSDAESAAKACFNVSGGIASGSTVAWISGGATIASAPASGSYAATRSIPLTGSSTYVRAEVRNSSGTQTAMSEPILFRRVAGLPASMSLHVDGVTTPSGHGYTRPSVLGITGATWDGIGGTITLSLANPVGSLVEFEMATAADRPIAVSAGSASIPQAASLDAFNAATSAIWFYDATTSVLHVKANQSTASMPTVVSFTTAGGGNPTPSASAASATPAPTSGIATFAPAADAYVSAGSPTANYGSLTSLRVDGSPTIRSYLRFGVNGLPGAVTKATLRVYANSAQSTGFDVWGVADNAWSETTITYGNAPPLAGFRTGSSGAVSTGTWKTVDVTQLVAGNGTYSLALTTTNATALSLASRESANAPQLIVTTSGAAGSPSPTPQPSASATPTTMPTATPTPIATASATPAPSGSLSMLTFKPVADAYVAAAYPTTNYGTLTTLRVDGSPIVQTYLRFSVSGVPGTVTKAVLRVYANSAQSVGYDVWSVSDSTWSETGITYANAPAWAASKAGSSGPVATGTWTSVDVTAIVTGNGTYSVALTTTSATALSLASRESANAPQLVVTITG